MFSIFYYVPIYLALAALGMSLGNKRVEAAVRKQRWLKYFSYVAITGIIIASILLQFFSWISIIIALAGVIELLRATLKTKRLLSSTLIYGLIACGFICFSFNFKMEAVLFI